MPPRFFRRWQVKAKFLPGKLWRVPEGGMKTLAEMAVEVLTTADGRAKTALGRAHAATWFAARAAGTPLPIASRQSHIRLKCLASSSAAFTQSS